MSELALAVSGAALLTTAVVLVGTRSWRTALLVLVELLTAAGLLRLADDVGWTQIATAAAVIAVREIVVASLRAYAPCARG